MSADRATIAIAAFVIALDDYATRRRRGAGPEAAEDVSVELEALLA